MNLGKTAKNATIYTIALVIQKVISFVYFSYLAIALGPEKLGIYSYSLSILATAVIFTDFGINNVITREVAANNENTLSLIKVANKIKRILSLITVIGIGVFCLLVETDNYIRVIILLAGLSMIGDTFANAYFSALRGLQKLSTESLMAIISPFISAVLGVVVVITTQDLRLLALSLALGSWLSFISGYYSIKKISCKQTEKISIKHLFSLVGPFAVASVSSKIYGYADTILIRFLSTASQLGFYGLAYKAAFALQFIPLAAMAGVYPAMSNANANNDEKRLYYLLSSSLKYVLVLGLPLTAVIIIFGKQLITTIYGHSYDGSITPLIILFLSLPMLFSTFPLGAWLNATRRQTANTRNVVIVMVVSVVLNIIYLPVYGAVGAASVSLFCTGLLFCLHSLVVIKNYNKIITKRFFINIFKISLTGLMPLIFGLISSQLKLPLLFGLMFSFIGYIFALVISKVLPKQIGERWSKLKIICQK